jgi:hypothetical protein
MSDAEDSPFKGFAHPQSVGLTVGIRDRRWAVTIETPDRGPYPPFDEYHQTPMSVADVQRFISGVGLEWQRQEAGAAGQEELVATDNGFRVRLTPALDTPLEPEAMVADWEALLGGAP